MVRRMVEAEAYKHLSLRSLALPGKRLGRVFAAYETWCRLVRAHGWRRPRRRLYPAKPKIGLRAGKPGEWVHIDVTIIRLLNGTRSYLHAIVDNYSRRVLAWALEPRLTAATTRRILREALADLPPNGNAVNVMTDGGAENLVFEEEHETAPNAHRVVAQIDVAQSNSMVEALWHQLRHRWLYLHTLDTFDAVERLVTRYFADHNALIPRAELGGRTPDEAFIGIEADLEDRLRESHRAARAQRVGANQHRWCHGCRPEEVQVAACA